MRNILILGFCFVAFMSNAQQTEQSSLYMYNALYYNPAYAGSRNTLNATFLAREQWIGYDKAPSSQFVSVHTPVLNQKLGVGMHVNNDRLGARQKTAAYLDLAGSIRLNKRNDRLNIGMSAGVDSYTFGFNDLYAVDPNDPVAISNYSELLFNVGAGIYYYGDKHYMGLSVPMVLNQEADFSGVQSNITRRHFILTGGYVFGLNSVVDFKPSTIVKFVPGAPLSFDLNASFLLYDKVWIGGMYRFNEGPGINASVVIKDQFTVGYAYDYPINELRTHQQGSHEIVLQFDFSKYKKHGRTYSPRYF